MEKKVLSINGVKRMVIVEPEQTLADVIREPVETDRNENRLQTGAVRLHARSSWTERWCGPASPR